jgi:hypothetical protein
VFIPRANIANARIDFRLDFWVGAVVSGCPAWLCSSDVWVTCINLKLVNKKRSHRWVVVATAPLRGTQLELT